MRKYYFIWWNIYLITFINLRIYFLYIGQKEYAGHVSPGMHAKWSASSSTSASSLNVSSFRISAISERPPTSNHVRLYAPFSVAFCPEHWPTCADSIACCTHGWMAAPKCFALPIVFSIVTGGMRPRLTCTIAPGTWSCTIGCTCTCTKIWSSWCSMDHAQRPHWSCSRCRPFFMNSFWAYRFDSSIRSCLHCSKVLALHLCLFAFAVTRRWEISLFGRPLHSAMVCWSVCTVWNILREKIVRLRESPCGIIWCRCRGDVTVWSWMKHGRFSHRGRNTRACNCIF